MLYAKQCKTKRKTAVKLTSQTSSNVGVMYLVGGTELLIALTKNWFCHELFVTLDLICDDIVSKGKSCSEQLVICQ